MSSTNDTSPTSTTPVMSPSPSPTASANIDSSIYMPAHIITGLTAYSLAGCLIILLRRILRRNTIGFNWLLTVSIIAWFLLAISLGLQTFSLWAMQHAYTWSKSHPTAVFIICASKITSEFLGCTFVMIAMYLRVHIWDNPRKIVIMTRMKVAIQVLLGVLIVANVTTIGFNFYLNDTGKPLAQRLEFRKFTLPFAVIRSMIQTVYSLGCTLYFLYILSRGIGLTFQETVREIFFRPGGPTLLAAVSFNFLLAITMILSIPGLGDPGKLWFGSYLNIWVYSMELQSFLSISYKVAKDLVNDCSTTDTSDVSHSYGAAKNLKTSSISKTNKPLKVPILFQSSRKQQDHDGVRVMSHSSEAMTSFATDGVDFPTQGRMYPEDPSFFDDNDVSAQSHSQNGLNSRSSTRESVVNMYEEPLAMPITDTASKVLSVSGSSGSSGPRRRNSTVTPSLTRLYSEIQPPFSPHTPTSPQSAAAHEVASPRDRYSPSPISPPYARIGSSFREPFGPQMRE